jgi:hypothetical protein
MVEPTAAVLCSTWNASRCPVPFHVKRDAGNRTVGKDPE